jgi:hypothetical protein
MTLETERVIGLLLDRDGMTEHAREPPRRSRWNGAAGVVDQVTWMALVVALLRPALVSLSV